MNYSLKFYKCRECDKEFALERQINGSDHTLYCEITCQDCLSLEKVNEDFKLEYPDEYEKLKNWVKNRK